MTPDQGCCGCLVVAVLVLVSLLVWGFIYWYNEPNFHDRGPDEYAPTVQEQIRQRETRRHSPAALPQGKSDGK